MGTFIKAFLISASIAGLVNMAAMAASPVVPGIQDETDCPGVTDKAGLKRSDNKASAATATTSKKADKATGGGMKKPAKKK